MRQMATFLLCITPAKVGYLRRNELVPVPRFNDLAEENRHFLERCESDMQREHYDDDDNRFISELFEDDKARLRPLPCDI